MKKYHQSLSNRYLIQIMSH